jgi:hypothetical protein
MARYPLIIRDETYFKLLKIAADKGLTMGKFLNEQLDQIANVGDPAQTTAIAKKIENPCFTCKAEAITTLEHTSGRKELFCSDCARNALESGKWRGLKT